MTERILTTLFSKFLKEHPPEDTYTYEIKMVKTNRFSFKSVQPHQVEGLLTSLEGLGHKISDSPIYSGSLNRFTLRKPFDYVFIKAKRAFIVPIFYKPKLYKRAFLIPVKKFIEMSKKGKSINIGELEKSGIESIFLSGKNKGKSRISP